MGLRAFTPAVWLADFVAWDEPASAAAAAQASAVVVDSPGRSRSHDAAVFQDAGNSATHQAVQLEPHRRPPSARRGL